MKKLTIVHGLLAVVVFQVLVLAGEYLTSVYPLMTGEKVILKINPVDPRSLFRGNYVDLNYDIARVGEQLGTEGNPAAKAGTVVYVGLREKDGVFEPAGVQTNRPSAGVFIRGRVQSNQRLRYGIEAYFTSKNRALAIERKFAQRQRQGLEIAYAQVRITAGGKAALETLLWELP